jgi:hypothetical protein
MTQGSVVILGDMAGDFGDGTENNQLCKRRFLCRMVIGNLGETPHPQLILICYLCPHGAVCLDLGLVSVLARVASLAFRLRDAFIIMYIGALLIVAAEPRVLMSIGNQVATVLTPCDPTLGAQELEDYRIFV